MNSLLAGLMVFALVAAAPLLIWIPIWVVAAASPSTWKRKEP